MADEEVVVEENSPETIRSPFAENSAPIFRRFMESIRNKGLATTNNFYMQINMRVPTHPFQRNQADATRWQKVGENGYRRTLDDYTIRNLSLMCKSITLPARKIETVKFERNVTDISLIAQYQDYSNFLLPVTFYVSPDMKEKIFFENWMNLVIDPISKLPNYYDEYARDNTITVFTLPKVMAGAAPQAGDKFYNYNQNNPKELPLYFTRFYQCYPTEIEETELSTDASGSGAIMEIKVNFTYKFYRTITDINDGSSESINEYSSPSMHIPSSQQRESFGEKLYDLNSEE
jgi:hypothetical protein